MDFFSRFKSGLYYVKCRLTENNIENVFWIVNFVPRHVGFSLDGVKIFVPFWILHLSLLFYVYAVGIAVYQFQYANEFEDLLISYVNVSLLILIADCSYWHITQKPLLVKTLKRVFLNDQHSLACPSLIDKYKRQLSTVKKTIMIFYSFNVINATFVYLPNRIDPQSDFAMAPCVGMEPLTESPRREICSIMLFTQEITIMVVVLNYQALLLFLIGHTTIVYKILTEDMQQLQNSTSFNNGESIKKKISNLINRHSLTLETVNLLKALYNAPVGVNFISNAVCISLFFLLPLEDCVKFFPIMGYCFIVFFLYCYLCQRLINATEEFQMSIYTCGWENLDVNDQKAIYIMLIMSQKPVELMAADIIPVNIYTFATTLQFMYKFVTLIKF